MRYKVIVECVAGPYLRESCVRALVMEDTDSLFDLHQAIQSAVDFGRDHPYAFYTANSRSPFAHAHWITLEEDWDAQEDIYCTTTLRTLWPMGRRKLYYLFDFGDKWLFEIRKPRLRRDDAENLAPGLLDASGPNPQQYPMLEGM